MSTEGTKACLPGPPLRFVMVPYYLFGGYRIQGGPQWQGGETPRERSGFFKDFSRAEKHISFIGGIVCCCYCAR